MPQGFETAHLCAHAGFADVVEPGSEKLEDHTADVRAAWQRPFKQRPHRLGHDVAVRVEIEAVELHAAGDVNFADMFKFDLGQQRPGVEAVVARVGVEVVQIKHQATATLAAQRVEEARFVHLGLGDVEVVDVVLKQKRRRHALLHFMDARHQHVQRAAVARQRQGDADVHRAPFVLRKMKGQMVAMPGEVKALPPALNLRQVRVVQRTRATDRQPDAVRDERALAAQADQGLDAGFVVQVTRPRAGAKVGPQDVGHDLDEVDIGAAGFDHASQRRLVGQAHTQWRQGLIFC